MTSRRVLIASVLISTLAAALPTSAAGANTVVLTLTAEPSAAHLDDTITFTVTTSPAVEGLQIKISASCCTWYSWGQTDADGKSIQQLVDPLAQGFWNIPADFQASLEGDADYQPATSNLARVDFSPHPASIAVRLGTITDPVTAYTVVDSISLTTTLTADVCTDRVSVYHVVDDVETLVGGGAFHSVSLGNGSTACLAEARVGNWPVGDHVFRVRIENSLLLERPQVDIHVPVSKQATAVALVTRPPTTVEVNGEITLEATARTTTGSGSLDSQNGEIAFYDGEELLASVEPSLSGVAQFTTHFSTVGTHVLTAKWSGTGNTQPSTSPDRILTVSPNVVHARNFSISASSVYPVKDGYRDSVTVKGYLEESASIAIKVSNASTGKVVRTITVPTRGPGWYSATWNGRYSSGTIVPAGSYRIRQELTDTLGAKLAVTNTVAVSAKKLYWYSGSQVKYANSYTAKGSSGGTISTTSKYYRGMRLTLPLGTPGRWAGLGYQFSLPSATTYRYLGFSVLGSGNRSPIIAMHDRRLGTWPSGSKWIIDYFSPRKSVPTSYGWTKVYGDSTYNRNGRTVRGLVLAQNWSSGTYYIAKVRLSYQYGILK